MRLEGGVGVAGGRQVGEGGGRVGVGGAGGGGVVLVVAVPEGGWEIPLTEG